MKYVLLLKEGIDVENFLFLLVCDYNIFRYNCYLFDLASTKSDSKLINIGYNDNNFSHSFSYCAYC